MATYYVHATGNDANAGTSQGLPLRTVTGAYSKSSAGDTVYVGTGRYQFPTVAGDAKNITWIGTVADNQLQTYWFSSTQTRYYINGTISAPTYFKNIYFDQVSDSYTATYFGYLFKNNGTQDMNFENCVFYKINHTQPSSPSPEYPDCIFSQDYAGSDMNFTSCLFFNPVATGFLNAVFGNNAGNVNFYNCTYYTDTNSQTVASPYVLMQNAIAGSIMKNSIFHNSSSLTYRFLSDPGLVANFSVSNSYKTGLWNASYIPSSVSSIDPKFVDAPNANFNLRRNSPLRNAGGLT